MVWCVSAQLYVLCPPKSLSRPSMVFVFELFCLPTPKHNLSRVLGWAAFPMCSPTFDVIEGKFKVPFLRGEVDPGLTLHSEIDDRIRRDLDNWLCNMYFDVQHLPRYMDNQSEYEVELDYTAQLLNMPNLRPTALSTTAQGIDFRTVDENDRGGTAGGAGGGADDAADDAGADIEHSKNRRPGDEPSRSGAPTDYKDEKGFLKPGGVGNPDMMPLIPKKKSLSRGTSHDGAGGGRDGGTSPLPPMRSAPGTAGSDRDQTGAGSSLGTRLAVTVVRKQNRPFQASAVVDGDDEDGEGPSTGGNRAVDAKRNKARLLRQYKFAVTNVVGDVPPDTKAQRVRFFFGEVVSDVSLSRWKTMEWWSTFIFAIIVFYLRFLIHYLGQYLYLVGKGTPVTDFTATPYTVRLFCLALSVILSYAFVSRAAVVLHCSG